MNSCSETSLSTTAWLGTCRQIEARRITLPFVFQNAQGLFE